MLFAQVTDLRKLGYTGVMTILRSTLFLVLAEVIFALSGYFIAAGLGRFLGPGEYGRYSLVIGFTTMIIILIGRGIPTAMAKRIAEHAGEHALISAIKRTAARWQYSIITVATVTFYLSAPLIARGFGDTTLTPLFELAAFVIPAFALSSFHVLYFNGLKRFGAMSTLKMARGLLRLGWIVGLGYFFGIYGAVTGAIIAPLGVFALALMLDKFAQNQSVETVPACHSREDGNPDRQLGLQTKDNLTQAVHIKALDSRLHGNDICKLSHIEPETKTNTKNTAQSQSTYPVRKLLTYAGGFMLFLLFYEFFVRVDIYLIKRILGDDTAVGLYNAAMTIALIPYYLLYALALVLFPTISSLTTKGNHHAGKLLSQTLRLLLIVLIPIGLLMALFAKPLTLLLFGAQFDASGALVPLMIGGTIFGTIFYILAAAFNGAGLTRIPASIVGTAIVVSIITNFALMPTYGIIATALIFSLTSTVMGTASLIAAKRIFGTTINIHTILRILLSVGILGTIVYILIHNSLINTQSIATMFIGGGILFVSYLAILTFLGELTKKDLSILRKTKNLK